VPHQLTRQQKFFSSHLQPWVGLLCDALASHPAAHFYAALALLTRHFMDVEAQGFDMLG
jgi:TorA maturation chaperone TorD